MEGRDREGRAKKKKFIEICKKRKKKKLARKKKLAKKKKFAKKKKI